MKKSISEQVWEQTLDCISDMVIMVDGQERILRCNKAVAEFVDRPYNELLGENWEDLLLGNGLETHYSQGKSIEFYHRSTNKWFLLDIYDYGVNESAVTSFVITLHETTKLKQIAEELGKTSAESEAGRRELKAALDEISSLIENATVARQSRVRFEHPALQKCWEVMKCHQKNCPCYGKEPQRCWQKRGTLCSGGMPYDWVEKISVCYKCTFYREATRNPIFQIGEQFNNMMHIIEEKNSELDVAHNELKATLAKSLQQEKLASIGQLAAGVAHELNNPLGFITSNLGSLRKYMNRLTEFLELQSRAVQTDDQTTSELALQRRKLRVDHILEDTVSLLDESLEGADRLKKIILELKSFSRVDQTQTQLSHANIIDCLESTINIVWNELKYNAVVTRDYGELPLTKCYPQRLNQVFLNLLINAAHAIGNEQGEIVIRAWCEDDHIFVAISDTGCGIPEENLTKLFDPFFTTKEVGKGTGLGLSITYDIIKKHRGEITVQSRKGKGSTFTVKIPVVEGR